MSNHPIFRFNINLQTGPNPNEDIALHISVRLLEGYVARNSFENNSWGEEQGSGTLPIAPGQKFEVLILCEAKEFKV